MSLNNLKSITQNGHTIILPSLSINKSVIYENFKKKLDESDAVIIFSAHFDDAVLSMGSTIAYLLSKGKKVEVVTIFTRGTPYSSPQIKILLDLAGFPDAETYFQTRSNENEISLSSLGTITTRNLGFPDAAWRLGDNNEVLYPYGVIGDPLGPDLKMEAEILVKIKEIPYSEKTLVFTHLGWGQHVDHVVARDVPLKAFSNTIFYRDFPYSTRYPQEYPYIKENALEYIEWDEDFYKEKAHAIFKYTTQQTSLFLVNPMILPLERFYYRAL